MFRWIRDNRKLVLQASQIGCIAYWLLLVVATHWPSPKVVLAHNSDKAIHLVIYAGLGFLMGLQFRFGYWRTNRWPLATAVVVGLWAVIDELTQIPVPGRSADVMDCLADWAGCGIGIIAVAILVRLSPHPETGTEW
jgi:VanZ family protein